MFWMDATGFMLSPTAPSPTITIDEVPTEFSAWSHLTKEVTRFDPFRAKPTLQLCGIGPCGVNLSARRVDKSFDL